MYLVTSHSLSDLFIWNVAAGSEFPLSDTLLFFSCWAALRWQSFSLTKFMDAALGQMALVLRRWAALTIVSVLTNDMAKDTGCYNRYAATNSSYRKPSLNWNACLSQLYVVPSQILTISTFLSPDVVLVYEFLIMWVQQIRVRSNRLSCPQARSRIRERVYILRRFNSYRTNRLIIRSTNHGGLPQNVFIWPADSVFSSVGLSSCIPS